METRARPTIPAPNRTMIATQLGIPETTLMGDGEMARTVIDPLVQMMFAEKVKEHVKRTRKLNENIQFLWMVLWAQSSQAVQNRLEALNTYETMKHEKQNAADDGFVDGTGNLPSTNLDLKSVLGGLSYSLDQMAAKIDAIPAITGDDTVKKYKKELSNQVVTLMDRTDSMIAFYQQESTLAPK